MQIMITYRAASAAEQRSCRRNSPQQVVGGGAGGSGAGEPHARKAPCNAPQASEKRAQRPCTDRASEKVEGGR